MEPHRGSIIRWLHIPGRSIFCSDHPIEMLRVPHPFTLIIANTGISSPTRVTVGDVRQLWQSHPDEIEPVFTAIGNIVDQARHLIEHGKPYQMGQLMTEDHHLLQKLGVSSTELDQLVSSALGAGALGAKLSGGGRGGNIIALAHPGDAPVLAEALHKAWSDTDHESPPSASKANHARTRYISTNILTQAWWISDHRQIPGPYCPDGCFEQVGR